MVRKMLAVRAAVPLRNSVFATDRFGNGALHLAVVHDLPQMYDFILERRAGRGGAGTALKPVGQSLSHSLSE